MPTVQRPSPTEGRAFPGGQGPEDFEWTEQCTPDDDGMPGHAGCRCAAGSCERGICPCASSCLAPNEQGRLIALPPMEPAEVELTACGPACACFGVCACSFASACAAATEAVTLREQPVKGWCAYADEPLPAGLLMCQYAGEYISNAQAQRRLAEYDAAGNGHALLVLREWLPSGTAAMRLNIDATKRGNLARFFNHSCDGGNLKLLLGRRTGSLLPRVLFATRRPVAVGEELTWQYGPPNAGPGGRPCLCGTSACLGFMPHEDVAAVRQLQDILACSEQRARQLLNETGGDLDGAIALHFANPRGTQAAPQSPRTELRSLLGDAVTRQQAGQLLQRAGGSVAAAADLFFEDPRAAGPPGAAGNERGGGGGGASSGRARGGAARRGGRRGSREPITISDTPSGEDEEESSEEEEEEEEQRHARPQRPPASAGRGVASSGRGQASARPRTMQTSSDRDRGALAPLPGGAAAAAGAGAGSAGGGGRGLVRSPRRGGGGGLPVGLGSAAGGAWNALLASIVGGALYGDSSEGDDYSEYTLGGSSGEEYESDEEQGEEPGTPRLAPKLTGALPEMNSAAAAWAQQRALHPATAGTAAAAPAAEPLPLAELRKDGRLFTERQDAVPAVVRPSQPLRLPLLLGRLELPLATLDEQGLRAVQGRKHWSELEWGGKSKLFHNYEGPKAQYRYPWGATARQRPLPLSEYAGMGYSTAQLEGLARLALYGADERGDTAVASVREEHSWAAELLYSLWVLETAGIADLRMRLVARAQQGKPAQDGQEAQQQQQQQQQQQEASPSPGPDQAQNMAAGGSSRAVRRSKSRSREPSQPASSAAAVAAKRGPMRGARAAPIPAAQWPADQAGPSSGSGRGKSNSRSPGAAAGTAPAAGSPDAVLIEIQLTEQLCHQLWWDEEDGDLSEQMEGGKGKKKGHRGGVQRWTKNGAALGKVVAALLQHGWGLGLGPDADGLLNLGDTQPQEWEAAAAAPNRAALFDVQRLLDSVAYKPALPPAMPPPRGLAVTPKQYQLTGLQWMLNRETKGDALHRGQLHLHPAWVQLRAADGQVFYLHRLRPHVASPNFYPAPVGGTCGGFLVDEMGLGKTLQTLMLVLSNPAPKGWAVSRLDGLTVSEDSEPVPIKTSLIVVPANLLGQWSEEIERHVEPGRLKWCRYVPPGATALAGGLLEAEAEGAEAAGRPQRRSRRVAEAAGTVNLARGAAVRPVQCLGPNGASMAMHEADVVLMSYEQLREQLHASAGSTSLLHQFGFWRVVLDEAQLVANSSSVAAVVASSLWRRHAWVVTGTPIASRLDEIKGLLEFLAHEPYHHAPVWRGLLQHGYEGQSAGGLLSLRALLRGVMLRRSKADVAHELELPPCTREDRWLELSSVETLCYNESKRKFCDAAYALAQHQGAAQRGQRAKNTKAVGRALAAFTALRQSCCHPQIVRRTDELLGKDRKSMREIMFALVVKAYGEWDQAARRLLDARLILAAVQGGVGSHPEECLRPLIDLIRANQAAAGSADIRHQATSVRKMYAEVAAEALAGGAGAGGGDGGGASAAVAAAPNGAARGSQQQTQQVQQQQAQEQQQAQQSEEAGKGTPPAPQGQEQPARQSGRRKRLRDGSDPASASTSGRSSRRSPSQPAGGSQQQQSQQQQQPQQATDTMDAGAAAAAAVEGGVEPGDRELAERMQAEENARGAQDAQAEEQAQADGGREERAMTQEERDAAARLRAWQKLELDALELFAHMLRQCASGARPPAGKGGSKAKGKGKGKKQAGKAESEEDSPVLPAKRRRQEAAGRASAAAAEAAAARPQHGEGSAEAGSSAAVQAAAGSGYEKPSKEALQAQLEECLAALDNLKAELGLRQDGVSDGRLMRRSRRRAGIDAEDTEAEVPIDLKEAEEQLLNAKLILRSYNEAVARRDPEKSAKRAVETAEKEAAETWHHLQHMLNKEGALVAAEKGKARAEAGGATLPAQATDGVQQEDLNSCPICLDELSARTITACGHHYCSTCIREVLAHGSRTCPICRMPLTEDDLFDAVSEEEARLNAELREAGAAANADYGAKVSALLAELAAMRAVDPSAKAVVFSSWGRLLKLVGEALAANGVRHASLAGANPAQREAALHAFLHEPDCAVLTVVMSTAGGAAGLTLTAATTAILLEPSLNPGLEAQAAARIWRLGQDKPTRVVRFLAKNTVEAQVLDIQRRKLESGEVAGSGVGAAAAAAAGAAAGDGAAGPSAAGDAGAGDAQAATALADVDAGMLLTVWEAIK